MRLTVLGSGTLLPDDDRRSAAHLVETADTSVLLDCGAGTVHGFDRHGVDWRRVRHLALSHFHTDHVGDVAPFLWALRHGLRPPRTEPLTVLGPPGLRDFLHHLAGAHGGYVLEPGFPVRIVETERSGSFEDPDAGLRLACHPTHHTESSVCWRVEATDGTVAYTGDTGEDDAAAAFLAGADVLVAECSLPDPLAVDTHLSPRTVAAFARIAGPRLLLLTHLYPPLDPERVPDLVAAAGYAGAVRTARDGMTVVLAAGRRPRVLADEGRQAP